MNLKIREVPSVNLKTEYEEIKQEIDEAITRVLNNTSFILGKEVKNFEESFKNFCESKFAIGVGSGTDALYLSLLILGTQPGDEIITTPLTFIATAEAITFAGGIPVFVDVDSKTHNLDPNLIEEKITNKTKAILPVHLHGQPVDLDPIIDIAKTHDLQVIEDAAQAHGSYYKKEPIGKNSDLTCFSFYPGKNLGAYGDAGAIITNNEELAQKAFMIRNHGRIDKYLHEIIGYNFRIDSLQAAILSVKLSHLTKWNRKRKKQASIYTSELSDLPLELPFVPEWADPVWHHYTIKLEQRDELHTFLKTRGIGVGIHYPITLSSQPAFAELNYNTQDFPIAENISKRILSLPIHGTLKSSEQEYVIDTIKEYFN